MPSEESNMERFGADLKDLRMLGEVAETEDRATPEQKKRSAENAAAFKQARAEADKAIKEAGEPKPPDDLE